MTINFENHAEVVTSFSIQWNGGETGRTGEVSAGMSSSIDTSSFNIPDGASCWARAFIEAGPNHDSGDNFTFHAEADEVTYKLWGGTYNPSFTCSGC